MISSATLYRRRDLLAVIALIALWLLFFWRLFTPVRDRAGGSDAVN